MIGKWFSNRGTRPAIRRLGVNVINAVVGITGLRPKSISIGDFPVLAWTAVLYAKDER
jgi:hypothetical protein